MRNEIFKQIQQNRKRYYAELSQHQVKNENALKEQPKDVHANPQVASEPYSFQFPSIPVDKEKLKKVLIERTTKMNSGLKKLFRPVSNQMNSVNSQINKKSQKLSDDFYRFSSSFFEDRFDQAQIQDNRSNTHIINLVISRQLEWELNWETAEDVSKEDGFVNWAETIQQQLKKRIRNWYHNTILFFEYDPGIVAMNEKLNFEETEIETKEIFLTQDSKVEYHEKVEIPKSGPESKSITQRENAEMEDETEINPIRLIQNIHKIISSSFYSIIRYNRII